MNEFKKMANVSTDLFVWFFKKMNLEFVLWLVLLNAEAARGLLSWTRSLMCRVSEVFVNTHFCVFQKTFCMLWIL